jgi:hypothetical protein
MTVHQIASGILRHLISKLSLYSKQVEQPKGKTLKRWAISLQLPPLEKADALIGLFPLAF